MKKQVKKEKAEKLSASFVSLPSMASRAAHRLKVDEAELKRTGVVMLKCPKCGGEMELDDMCCGGEEVRETYHCKACGHVEDHKGIFALEIIIEKKIEGLAEFAEVLIKVPSLSPAESMQMLAMATKLREQALIAKAEDTKRRLIDYAAAIEKVCAYSVIHQKIVIERFKELINKMKEES